MTNFTPRSAMALVLALAIFAAPHLAMASSATAVVGQTVTIAVTANGTQPFTYQWYKNGAAISGATSASYQLSSVTTTSAATYTATVTNAAGSTTSDNAVLTVYSLTAITQQPATQAVIVGQSATFSVTATGSGTLTYQWRKNGTNISGATSSTYTISNTNSSSAGSYSVVVTGAGGSTTSNSATLTVNPAPVAGSPDGYGSLATGGSAGTAVTVMNATDLRTYAQASSAYVITVSGAINLYGTVTVASNKTIQGMDGNSALVGHLDVTNVTNVIIRGLNITNPGTTIVGGAYTDGGNGITVRNSTNVFITHCTVYDCANNLIELSNGADYATVSWCEFYYTTAQTIHRNTMFTGVAGSETKPLHITLHHNWWSDRCDQNMPAGTYGYVHLFNNYFSAASNTSGTVARDNAQFFSEYNAYNQVKDPLYKENIDTAQAAGRIRAIGNIFTNIPTGRAVDAGTDNVFTPLYSYELDLADDLVTVTTGLAGNTAGSGSATPTASSASISGPTSSVSPGAAFTLTSLPTGFTGTSFQWRLNNTNISGATSSTYTVSSMQQANAGTYTVVIGLASGNYVVSTPIDVTLGTVTSPDPGSSSGGGAPVAAKASSGGGGGAPGDWYLAALLAMGLARLISRRRR